MKFVVKAILAIVVFINLAITLVAIVRDNLVLAWIATTLAAIFEYVPFVREYIRWRQSKNGGFSEGE